MTDNSNRGALLAGAAKVEITPQDLTGLTNLWRTPFNGVHDAIYVRALVVDNGMDCAAVIATDLVEVGDTAEIRERIEQEIGIPAAHIVITASHDHNAPRIGCVTPGATAQRGGPATENYTHFVYDCILDAVRQARSSIQPAQVGVGKGAADVNTNRDMFTSEGWKLGVDVERPSEKAVWVVKVEATSGEPIAILMNYAVHSVVLGPQNTLVTGDLAGATERYVEQSFDDKVVALWTMGPAADQNPKFMSYHENPPHFSERTPGYRLMETLGQMLGEEVLCVAGQIGKMKSDVEIKAVEKVVSLPARIPPRDANRPGMEVKQVEAINLRLGVLLIDQIALTWVSGEISTRIYWHLKKVSPLSNTILMTIANDRVGYIVEDSGYDTLTFAATASPFQRGYAEPAIVNGLLEMISS